MASTPPTAETPSVTSVSSPSARRLYYELADRTEASPTELGEAVDVDVDRVRELLSVLRSAGLVSENDGTFVV